jgi:hypothetical protein
MGKKLHVFFCLLPDPFKIFYGTLDIIFAKRKVKPFDAYLEVLRDAFEKLCHELLTHRTQESNVEIWRISLVHLSMSHSKVSESIRTAQHYNSQHFQLV